MNHLKQKVAHSIFYAFSIVLLTACGGGGGGTPPPPPPVNNAPTATAQFLTTQVNTSLDILLNGNDADNDTLSYTIVSDPVNGTLSGTAPNVNYTPNTDFAGDDSFTFSVNDGTVDSAAATISIRVDSSPVFTSGVAISVAENIIVTGYTAIATDADGDTVSYSLSGGTDQAAFSINSSSGELSFNVAPDFELPTDSDGNNTYVVGITATDGVRLVVQDVTVTVTDVVFELTASSIDIKTIQFDWPAISGATLYRLFVNPDGVSALVLLQDNLSGTSTSIELPVHLTDWINASYVLEAHDGTGELAASTPISISELMIESIGYFKASNTNGQHTFGHTVSLSADGNTLAVGASLENSNATGIDGDQANNTAVRAGAVYVFSRASGSWSQQAYIKASNTDAEDIFGWSVSLSADGNTLAVGAPFEDSGTTGINSDQTDNAAADAGAVYVFSRSGSNWAQQAYVKASNTNAEDVFGSSVRLSANGNTLAVGAPNEDSSAIAIDGDQTDNTAPEAGAVYVYIRSSGGSWSQQAWVKASNTDSADLFGTVVSLSGDGNTLAVSAPFEESIVTGIDGDQTDNTAEWAGVVYVYSRNGSSWSQQAYVKASNTDINDLFGASVSLSGDGNTLAVGAIGEGSIVTGIDGDQTNNTTGFAGAAYIFSRASGSWSQQTYVKASNTGVNDQFGFAISLSSDGATLAVGAVSEDSIATGIDGDQTDNTATGQAGAVYTYRLNGSSWSQQAYVKASNTGLTGDQFGWAVSLNDDGTTLAVSAPDEESIATGINGDQSDDTANEAGAVYVY